MLLLLDLFVGGKETLSYDGAVVVGYLCWRRCAERIRFLENPCVGKMF